MVINMTEENAKTETPAKSGLFNFIKKHPYLTGIPAVLISSYIGLRMMAAPYSEVSLGVVQEEVMLPRSSDEKSENILGIQIVGPNATDMIAEGVLAMKKGVTVRELASTIHAHPTLSEAVMEAALDNLGSPIHMPKKVR